MLSLDAIPALQLVALLLIPACLWAISRVKRMAAGPRRTIGVSLFVTLMGVAGVAGVLATLLSSKLSGPLRVTGKAVPDFAYRLVDSDAPQRFQSLRGNVVLLNYWATW